MPAAGSNAFDDATEATLPPLVIAADDDGLNGDDDETMRCSSSLLNEGAEELNLPTAAALKGTATAVEGAAGLQEAQCVYYEELNTQALIISPIAPIPRFACKQTFQVALV